MFFSGSNPKSTIHTENNIDIPKESRKNKLRSTILLVNNHHSEHINHTTIVTKKQINKNTVPHTNNPNLILFNIFYFKF